MKKIVSLSLVLFLFVGAFSVFAAGAPIATAPRPLIPGSRPGRLNLAPPLPRAAVRTCGPG